ncbi:dipeptidase [Microbacterium sp. NPDC008134]|uniref:dipeptidase n=1 Tax=Microbacterium sp. NPDC008134 TaxID=3364183 RepID=UPI0036E46FF7
MNAPAHPLVIDGCNPSRWDAPGVLEHLVEGGVTAINATTAIWEGYADTLDEIARWQQRFRTRADLIRPVRTADDVLRAREERRAGIILGWQNVAPIENDLDRIEVFQMLGVRIIQLAYNVRNLIANGCFEPHDDGLSLFGVKAVQRMNDCGILIDLSHVGDRSSRHAIDESRHPVAFTHTQLREYFDTPRNKPAELVRALVERGGVVGANAFPQFLPGGWDADLAAYIDGIERLIEVAGIDAVGIASDFCEGHGPEFWDYLGHVHGTTAMWQIDAPLEPTVRGIRGSVDTPLITAALRDRGYSDDEVGKVMGGNWLRLYREVWGDQPAAEPALPH